MRVFIGLSRLGAECRLQEMEEMLTKRTEMLVVVKQELWFLWGGAWAVIHFGLFYYFGGKIMKNKRNVPVPADLVHDMMW